MVLLEVARNLLRLFNWVRVTKRWNEIITVAGLRELKEEKEYYSLHKHFSLLSVFIDRGVEYERSP